MAKYFDFSFPARAQTRIRIVERPGRWMDDAQLASLVDDARRVVRAAVPAGSLDYGVLSGERAALDPVILTIIYCSRLNRAVAFSAMTILECEARGRPLEVLHLGLVLVDPAYRSRGFSRMLYGYTCFLLSARRQLRPIWISNVTQVPAVVGLVSEGFNDVFPAPNGRGRRSFDHLQLARQIMAGHRHVFGVGADAQFDEHRFVIENAYTGGSDNLKKPFEDASKHRDDGVNEWCRHQLDYDRGDDVLQLGKFSFPVVRRNFAAMQRVVSPAHMLLHSGLLFAEALVAPVLQWLCTTRQLGELRARKAAV